MNAMSKSSKSGGSGCGCGCGGGQTGLCACGDVGCATCRNQGFVRPRFFAGQLLTEEDLQKLIDYVVAKNRLHNQRLWGDGVVCGLEVSCHPCGGGTVVVNPGYALDCCGNDLLLGCPQELDINAMVRDLKRNLLGGYDCGDPCPPPKKKELKDAQEEKDSKDQPPPRTGANLRATPPPKAEPADDQKEPVIDTTRYYCLYIRYCENLTDPVSPYATDEGCSYQSCQPTRVSEGVRFELRCHDGCGHQTDIIDRICECIGDVDSAFQTTRYANAFYSLTRLQMPVPNVVLTDASMAGANFVNSVASLRNIRILKQPSAVKRRATTKGAPSAAAGGQPTTEISRADQPATISVQEFENWLSDVHTADAHLASYYLAHKRAGQPAEPSAAAAAPSEEQVRVAQKELLEVASKLSKLVATVPAPELARGYYASALKHTIELTSGQPQFDEARLLKVSKGLLLEANDLKSSSLPMKAMREELLDRLDRSPQIGDCQLRSDVKAIRIPDTEDGPEWGKAAKALYEAWGRYLKDCICAAMNPPCVPCEDPAVLLACIEVKDCEVIQICNLKRKFVISATAARYWLPQLNELGEQLEKLCCPEPICIEEEEPKASDQATNTLMGPRGRYEFSTMPSGHFDFRIFELLCGKRQKGTYRPQDKDRLIGSIRPLTAGSATPLEALPFIVPEIWQPRLANTALPLDRPVVDIFREAVVSDKAAFSTLIEPAVRRTVTDTLKTDEAKAAIRALVTKLQPSAADRAAITKKIEDLSTAISTENLSKSVAEALKAEGGATGKAIAGMADEKVAAAVEKLKLTGAARDLKEVKRIKTENVELTKKITELADRVMKLEGGTPR